MLASFYLFILPLVGVLLYLAYKFYVNKEKIEKRINNAFVEEATNNLEEAKELVFVFTDNLRDKISRVSRVSFHWLLHFFVIFLKFISDLTDILYAKSRDFFLKTATKEKDAVTIFWHHLKEYKKEKEEEKKNQ